MPNYNRAMPEATRDGTELILLVCTDDDAMPVAREIGWYETEIGRWEGDWPYYDGEGGYAKAEPIA
jgi:hypothetical protein